MILDLEKLIKYFGPKDAVRCVVFLFLNGWAKDQKHGSSTDKLEVEPIGIVEFEIFNGQGASHQDLDLPENASDEDYFSAYEKWAEDNFTKKN